MVRYQLESCSINKKVIYSLKFIKFDLNSQKIIIISCKSIDIKSSSESY